MGRSIAQNKDLTQGPLAARIVMFAIPLALTGMLQQLFNAADVAVVGQFAGTEAMAAVGANTAVVNFILNLLIGVTQGTNVVIAQSIGRRRSDTIKQAVHTSILFSVVAGAIMAVLGQFVAVEILQLTSVPADVVDMATTYLRIYMTGFPVIVLYNCGAAIFRAKGDSKTPLIALACSGLINVGLNLFFVAVLKIDVAGVALATVISNLVSATILMVILARAEDDTKFNIKELGINWKVLKKILLIGVPSGIHGAMFSLSNIVVQSAINSLGSLVMAASSAAFNLEALAFYMLNAFGQTATTFVGQNYGALKQDRCKKSLALCVGWTIIFTGLTVITILLTGKWLLSLFNPDERVVIIGYERLQYIFFAYCFSVFMEVAAGYLKGFGLSMLPAVVSLLGVCAVRVLWITFVFPLRPEFTTVLMIYPITLGLTAIILWSIIAIMRPSRKAIPRETN